MAHDARDHTGRYARFLDGFKSVTPESVGKGYTKPGARSDECKGGVNGAGDAEQSGADPYYDE